MARREMEASQNTWGRIAPAVTLAYDPISKSFYTGNDIGILRKFSLEALMDALDNIETQIKEDELEELTHNDIFVQAAAELGVRDYTSALFPVYDTAVSHLFSDK